METEEPICRRGRPREFDADSALDAAVSVFWRHGYEGASLSDLTKAMGINRPSLYAAFGNKEELFRRAMDRYEQRVGAQMTATLAAPTARLAVERLLRGLADGLTSGRNPAGCFLVVSALSCGRESAAVQEEASRRRRLSAAPLLRARFERAIAEGDLPCWTNAVDLAAFFATVIQGMSIQAASGMSRAGLQRVVDVAMRAWPGGKAGASAAGRRKQTGTRRARRK